MTTIHLILNAHLDPVWLWPWQGGLDALLATCRTACDLLDARPELHFCKGEAWGYAQIERVAPHLFERIRAHIAAGQWHIVGGWWIQPDCNGPSGHGLAQQIACGREYFATRFGTFPRTAYNVDSFGHAASLPGLMRAAGQDRYVMMRPQEHERTLPARLFRWRGFDDGPEVVVFRIAGGYAVRDLTREHLAAALTDLPEGVEHTMCFVGLGDHGGGPTLRQLEWLAANRNVLPGVRLEYSWPERFFDAIWPQCDALPLVTGELQMHAVGCYSVHRPVKVLVRQAEWRLQQAEGVLGAAQLAEQWHTGNSPPFQGGAGGALPHGSGDSASRDGSAGASPSPVALLAEQWHAGDSPPFRGGVGGGLQHDSGDAVLGDGSAGASPSHGEEALLREQWHKDVRAGWQRVCFAHFHDTYGGTCIPSAYPQVHAQLGAALTTADDILQTEFRRRMELLPDDPRQRVVLWNAAPTAHDDYIEHEAWFEHVPWQEATRLVDEAGHTVPYQLVHPEALVRHDATWFVRLLLKSSLAPQALRVLRFDSSMGAAPLPSQASAANAALENDARCRVRLVDPADMQLGADLALPLPRLELREDPSDTWSHGVERYGGPVVAPATWASSAILDRGPLMAALEQMGHIDTSPVRCEWRVYAGAPFVELLLHVHWCAQFKVLKLVLALPGDVEQRVDGIPGAVLQRAADGREYPIRDLTLLTLTDGRRLGVVLPDAHGLDVTPTAVGITLLRSPLMAHHDPYPTPGVRGIFADQGVHDFRFRFYGDPDLTVETLEAAARRWHCPPLSADLTRGMPPGPPS